MTVAGLVLAAIAALLHVYIFYLESIAWTTRRAFSIFGTTPEEAAATKELAFNQGFYNLFLAIATLLGVALAPGMPAVGWTLVFVGTGSMLAAALVLFLSSSDKRAAAIKQGTLPLLAVVVSVIGVLVG